MREGTIKNGSMKEEGSRSDKAVMNGGGKVMERGERERGRKDTGDTGKAREEKYGREGEEITVRVRREERR